jgi:adenine/guanine/hypoxanthine permease
MSSTALPWWDTYFGVTKRGSTLTTEVKAGFTTFLTMAYIIFVNAGILSFSGIPDLAGLGLEFAPTLVVTCLGAGLASIAMGLFSRNPIALAPGMGLNAVVAYQLIVGGKLTPGEAMGVIFLEGLAITVLMLTGFRRAIIDAIPLELKQAIGVGIGFFIMFIGLVDAGFVKLGVVGAPVALGDFTTLPGLMAFLGLAIVVFFYVRGIRGALLWGILATTLVAIVLNWLTGWTGYEASAGVAVIPSGILSAPDFSNVGIGFNFGVFAKFGWLSGILTIFSIMLSDFFDTAGTATAVGSKAGLTDENGNIERLDETLVVDSVAAMGGGFLGCSSVTSYIESMAGIIDGGRTGIVSLVVGVLFLLGMFISPLAGIIPAQATGAALILVGVSMCTVLKDIDFANNEFAVPAVLAIATMAFTYSITNGIGLAFVSYCFIKLVKGHAGAVKAWLWVAAAAFALYFALPWLRIALGL